MAVPDLLREFGLEQARASIELDLESADFDDPDVYHFPKSEAAWIRAR
jgi:hypothetical protein